MNTYVSRGLWFVLIVGGLTVAGATAANAAETSGDDGVSSGTQAIIGTSIPVNVTNNAISVLGESTAAGSGSTSGAGSVPATPADPAVTTSGDHGIASGSQGIVSPVVPVTIGGNAISVLGDSSSTGASGSPGTQPSEPASTPPAPVATTSGDRSLAGGTQLSAAQVVPVTVTGNAISGLGDSSSSSADDAVRSDASPQPAPAPSGTDAPAPVATTSGDRSLAGGTQLSAVPVVPVTVTGNAIGLVGESGTGSGTSSDGPVSAAPPATSPSRLALVVGPSASDAGVLPVIRVASRLATGVAGPTVADAGAADAGVADAGASVAAAASVGLAGMAPASGLTPVLVADVGDRTGIDAGARVEPAAGETASRAGLAHTGSNTTGWLALAGLLLTGGLVLIGLTERGGLRN